MRCFLDGANDIDTHFMEVRSNSQIRFLQEQKYEIICSLQAFLSGSPSSKHTSFAWLIGKRQCIFVRGSLWAGERYGAVHFTCAPGTFVYIYAS